MTTVINKIMLTRIAKIKGYSNSNVMFGMDKANIFKDGHVYNVVEIEGVITINDLGEHAEGYCTAKKGMTFWQVMKENLCLYTKEEVKRLDIKGKD